MMKVIKQTKPTEYEYQFGDSCCEKFSNFVDKEIFVIDNGIVKLKAAGYLKNYHKECTLYIALLHCIFCGEAFVLEEKE